MSRGRGYDTSLPRPLRWSRSILRARPPTLLVALFGGIALVAGSQLVVDAESVGVQLIEVGVPLLLSLPILYVAGIARSDRHPGALQLYALLLSALFAAIGLGMVTLVLWSQTYQGVEPVDPFFPIAVSLATASGIGSVSGMMYNDLAKTRLELSEEVQRTRTLNQQLMVINRVLRHNVRNTLASVYSTVDAVRSELSDPRLIDRLDTCRRSLDRLKRRADKTLYTERLESSQARVESDIVATLDATISAVLDRYEGVALETSMPDEARVLAHPLIDVALEEAIENAVMHTDAARVRLAVAVDVDASRVTVRISDDGPGIAPDELEAIELEEETPLKHTSGVGLWLIKWIVDASDGALAFSESAWGGQTVELVLDRAGGPAKD